MKMDEKKKEAKDIRYIVRIVGKDLDGNLPICRALMGIDGISNRTAKAIGIVFEKNTDISYDTKLGQIPEEKDKILEDIILNPEKHGLPGWILNRQKDFESGQDIHLVMGELDFSLRKDIQRLSEIKSYRGLRHGWGVTVRGQRTRSTHRGKGPVVGVMKKEMKQAVAKKERGKK